MARGKDLTTTELSEIKSLVNDGMTYSEVAELTGRTIRSIANAVLRYHLRDNPKKRDKKEAPKEWESDVVKDISEKNEQFKSVSVAAPKEKTLDDFPKRVIIKYLYDSGYRCEDLYCIVKQKVNLTDIIKNG